MRQFGGAQWADERVMRRMRLMPMIGRALLGDDDEILYIGGVVWFADYAEAILRMNEDFRPSPRSRWVHRTAIKLISAAHSASDLIYANPDPEVSNSREWLERLGFRPDPGRRFAGRDGVAEWWVHGLVYPVRCS
jgi:hypothetical protein